MEHAENFRTILPLTFCLFIFCTPTTAQMQIADENTPPDEFVLTATHFVDRKKQPIDEVRIRGHLQVSPSEIQRVLEAGPEDIGNAIKLMKAVLPFKKVDWHIHEEAGRRIATITVVEKGLIDSHFRLAGGFNRVDGLRLGPRLEWLIRRDIYQPPRGKVFGEVTHGFSNERWNYKLGAEAYGSVLRRLNLNLTTQIHRVTVVRDKDVLPSDIEQFWLAFFYGADFRDYYQRDGAEIALRWQPPDQPHRLTLTWLGEAHQSLVKSTNWSLFRRGTTKEENTAITPGQMRSFGVVYDFKSGNGLIGWHHSVRIEHGAPAIGSDFDFTQFQVHLIRYQPTSDNSSLAIRLKVGGSTKALPVQRQFIIGGPGTLRGYELYEFAGDRIALLNVEFRRFFIPDIAALFFVDAGQVWDDKAPFDVGKLKADVGIGLGISNAILDLTLMAAQALESDRKPRLTLRWARRF
jgi:hypothetical protein